MEMNPAAAAAGVAVAVADEGGTCTASEACTGSNISDDEKKTTTEAYKKKVVVVMGASGCGKSKLAIDLAPYFPPATIEIVNADSMQVYRGLDVLTNKVPSQDQNGIPHHLLGTVDVTTDFTSRDFRDQAIFIIDDILARGCLPVIVGGSNYYIQALVSPFLVDDLVENMDDCFQNAPKDGLLQSFEVDSKNDDLCSSYDRLKELDPIAANRIHPNDHRKIARYLNLYAYSGILPSELFRGKSAGKWGRPDNFRYNCCFLWLDVSLPVLDSYVERRVDSMMEAGLLSEVQDIYNPGADYTRGLRQAIGVREFEKFFSSHMQHTGSELPCCHSEIDVTESSEKSVNNLKAKTSDCLGLEDSKHELLLNDAIHEVKVNTRRLVRRQKRRLNRLQTLFGWKLHYIDATKALEGNSGEYWKKHVVEPCASLVSAFLHDETSTVTSSSPDDSINQSLQSRDLWTQYICEACGDQILRGAHEWDQHRLGRHHRKQVSRLRKKFALVPM